MFSFKKDNTNDDNYYILFLSCILSIFALFIFMYLIIAIFTFDVNINNFLNITFFTSLLSLTILIGFLIMPLIYNSVTNYSKTIDSDTSRISTALFI